MTRKKQAAQSKTPATQEQALLDALRSNLSLLGELAVRYEVATHPERPKGELPAISSPDDVRRLLGPEMSALAQEQLRVLLLNTRNLVVGQRGDLPGKYKFVGGAPRRGAPARRGRGRPQHHRQPQSPVGRPHAEPRGRGDHP